MNSGKEYEKFVYEKFKEFFDKFKVTLNDKIRGKLSGINREIDVSVIGKIDDLEILYIVQCKDHIKPADIKIIGEFSSVIKDLGASKGFLICSSGFTKTIHQYAKYLGIELLTIEDINSKKWKVEIEIPIIFIKQQIKGAISHKMIATPELVIKNKTDILITQNDAKQVSADAGKNLIKIIDYINYYLEQNKIDIVQTPAFEIDNVNLVTYFAELWMPTTISISFKTWKTYHLKYIRPDEYSQLKDHLTNGILPLKFSIHGKHLNFDESYLEIKKEEIPFISPLLLELTEDLYPLKHDQFVFPGFIFNHLKTRS